MKQEDTRQKILAKALELFSVHGYDAVSVGQIAAAVGIKAPSLYNHFPSVIIKIEIKVCIHLTTT